MMQHYQDLKLSFVQSLNLNGSSSQLFFLTRKKDNSVQQLLGF